MLLSNAFDPDPRVRREALALVQSGYRVTIVCWDRDLKSGLIECVDGINVERIRVASTHGRGAGQMIFLLLFWLKAFFHAIGKEYQVVHAHDFDTLPLGYLLAGCRRTKLIYDSHESYVGMLDNLPPWLKSIIFHAETWMLKRADVVITVGELLRNHLVARGASQSAIVGNWQDPALFRFDNAAIEEVRRRVGVERGATLVCYIAHLGHERQIPQLIEAVERSSGVHLLIGGNGPCRELVEKAAARNGRITYLGVVAPTMIPLYTASSDAVFYGFDPDNPNANFSAPNKLFEALAAGKPIITCNFGEIGAIVSREGCGVVLPDYSAEAIAAALETLRTEAALRMSAVAQRLGESVYSWSSARDTLLTVYATF